MVLFLGWSAFLEPFSAGQFIAAYISVSKMAFEVKERVSLMIFGIDPGVCRAHYRLSCQIG